MIQRFKVLKKYMIDYKHNYFYFDLPLKNLKQKIVTENSLQVKVPRDMDGRMDARQLIWVS